MAAHLNDKSSEATLRLPSSACSAANITNKQAAIRPIVTAVRSVLIFGIAYGIAFGYASRFSENTASPLWFPDSVLLCAFLVSPRNFWGWYLLVATPIRLLHGTAPVWFLGATYLNDVLKAVSSAYLLQRLIRGPVRLNTLRQFGIYMTTAAISVPLLSAVGGAAARVVLGNTFWRAFFQWFLGDATAALVLTPTLLYWCFDGVDQIKTRAGLFFSVVLTLGASLYFTFLWPHSQYSPIVLYAPLPLLILTATMLRPVGVSTGISMLALVSTVSAVEGRGAFFMVQSEHSVIAMQLFLIVISVPMLFVAVLIEERKAVETELGHSRETLRESYTRIQDLAGKLLHSQEQERSRIARELHDDICQRLALVSAALEGMNPASTEQDGNSASALVADVQAIGNDLHEISRQLHSSNLQHLGLERSLKNICVSIAQKNHIDVQFASDAVEGLPDEVSLPLPGGQEALSNAVRHGKAKRIQVLLQKEEGSLRMNVSDEGEGFDPATLSDGLGLLSMRERVRFLGGTVSIKSQVGRGTEVDAEVPIRKSA